MAIKLTYHIRGSNWHQDILVAIQGVSIKYVHLCVSRFWMFFIPWLFNFWVTILNKSCRFTKLCKSWHHTIIICHSDERARRYNDVMITNSHLISVTWYAQKSGAYCMLIRIRIQTARVNRFTANSSDDQIRKTKDNVYGIWVYKVLGIWKIYVMRETLSNYQRIWYRLFWQSSWLIFTYAPLKYSISDPDEKYVITDRMHRIRDVRAGRRKALWLWMQLWLSAGTWP